MSRTKTRRPDAPCRPALVRCAIYTRKSTDEGLNQPFNTLDAQRQAGEAYIKSQVGAGWVALPQGYDDGGFSGATTDRPAFTRLLADVEAGRVDAVVVYRLDRLSRNLADFANLMESFHQRNVTFASVTEQFSTSTPGGRVTLNVMASFAQYEREVISERTRDKMRAARRKGMWTGGPLVLGYDLVDSKLVVHPREAEQVVAIFKLYLELGSVMACVQALNERGWKTKSWTSKPGRVVVGRRFDKSSLRRLLRNPLYAGWMPYKGERHVGQHTAIVDQETFAAVGRRLELPAERVRSSPLHRHDPLLKGIAFCGVCGSTLTYSHTQRGSREFAYYVCRKVTSEGASACPGSRAPAGELERIVVDRVRALADAPDQAESPPAGCSGVIEPDPETGTSARETLSVPSPLRKMLKSFGIAWAELFPRERARMLRALVERVEFDGGNSQVALTLRDGVVEPERAE